MKTIWKLIDALARAVIALMGKVSPKLGGFCEKLWNNTELVREFVSFITMRLVSFGMELVLMFLTVDILGLNDLAMKLIINIVVIILNYVFSKLFIFKK